MAGNVYWMCLWWKASRKSAGGEASLKNGEMHELRLCKTARLPEASTNLFQTLCGSFEGDARPATAWLGIAKWQIGCKTL